MQYKTIQDLIDAGKVVEDFKFSFGYDNIYKEINKIRIKKQLPEDFYVVYVTNIFLDKRLNKYKNTKPIPCCIIKNMFGQIDGKDDYRLETLGKDIWETYYRYSHLDMIDYILEHGCNYRILKNVGNGYREETKHEHIKIWETSKEASSYIRQFKEGNDLSKYETELNDITKKIEELLIIKKNLEELIKTTKNKNESNS